MAEHGNNNEMILKPKVTRITLVAETTMHNKLVPIHRALQWNCYPSRYTQMV